MLLSVYICVGVSEARKNKKNSSLAAPLDNASAEVSVKKEYIKFTN